jgi:hypothetical protein
VKYSLNVVPEPERKISLEDVDIDGRIMWRRVLGK